MDAESAQQSPNFERDYIFEAFYQRWGAECGIDYGTLATMWRESASLMPEDSPEFGYHNAWHIRATLWAAMEICDREEDINPALILNRRVLTLGAMYHDAGYSEDSQSHGFDSKEAYSAHLMTLLAPLHGFTADEIAVASNIIMATKLNTAPQTAEERVMIEADIANTGQDYEADFKPAFLQLAREDAAKKAAVNLEYSFAAFGENSIKVLCTYLGYLDKNSLFVKQAVANIRRLAGELAAEQHMPVLKYILKLKNATVIKVLGYRLPFKRN